MGAKSRGTPLLLLSPHDDRHSYTLAQATSAASAHHHNLNLIKCSSDFAESRTHITYNIQWEQRDNQQAKDPATSRRGCQPSNHQDKAPVKTSILDELSGLAARDGLGFHIRPGLRSGDRQSWVPLPGHLYVVFFPLFSSVDSCSRHLRFRDSCLLRF